MKKFANKISLLFFVAMFSVVIGVAGSSSVNAQTSKELLPVKNVMFYLAGMNHMTIEDQTVRLYKDNVFVRPVIITEPVYTGGGFKLELGPLEYGNWKVEINAVAYRLYDNTRYEFKHVHEFTVDKSTLEDVIYLKGVLLKERVVKIWLKEFESPKLAGETVEVVTGYTLWSVKTYEIKYDYLAKRPYIFIKDLRDGFWIMKLDSKVSYSNTAYLHYQGKYGFTLDYNTPKELYFEKYTKELKLLFKNQQ